MWKLKKLIIILATIASYSCHGAGGPASVPAAIVLAPQKKKSCVCSICGKSCLRKYFTRHMRAHASDRPHTCLECGKSFLQKCHLKDHTRTHTGEKPYACNECSKAFALKGNLTVHMRTHTGERPYHCSECGRDLAGKTALIVHMRRHTGERPYACSKCTTAFSKKWSLDRHLGVCKYVPLKQRDETDSEEEFEDPDVLEERLKSKRIKIRAALAVGPDVFGETGMAAPAAKARAAKEDLD